MSRLRSITAPLVVGLSVGLLATAPPLQAQNLLDQTSAGEIRTRFMADLDSVHVKIMALAELIPAEKYGWSPTPETRTIANTLMHVASEWYFFVPLILGATPPAELGSFREAVPKLERIATKAEVLEHLRKAWDSAKQLGFAADLTPLLGTRQFFGRSTTMTELVLAVAGDQHEHLGQMVTYTRSIGLVPPWSKKPGG